MDFCCNYNSKSISNLLYDQITEMKIYKESEFTLFKIKKIFENLDQQQEINSSEFSNKLSILSEKAKKNFENSQRQLIKEKYNMLCQKFLLENFKKDSLNVDFNTKIMELIYELAEGNYKKIIFYFYSLINEETKVDSIPELIFTYVLLPNDYNSNENKSKIKEMKEVNSLNFSNFRYILIDYIYRILTAGMKALCFINSKNWEVFNEVNDYIENWIQKEKIAFFVDDLLKEFDADIAEANLKRKNDEISKDNMNVKKKNFSFIEEYEITEEIIFLIFRRSNFLNNICELSYTYEKFCEENQRFLK